MRAWLASARTMAWRIHHAAYVEKRVPRSGFELLHRAHEAEIALLDEIGQGQAAVQVAAGDLDDQAEVGLGEAGLGSLVAGLHAPREVNLFLAGEEADARDLREVQAQVGPARVPGLGADIRSEASTSGARGSSGMASSSGPSLIVVLGLDGELLRGHPRRKR